MKTNDYDEYYRKQTEQWLLTQREQVRAVINKSERHLAEARQELQRVTVELERRNIT
jgi:hypothetical protein